MNKTAKTTMAGLMAAAIMLGTLGCQSTPSASSAGAESSSSATESSAVSDTESTVEESATGSGERVPLSLTCGVDSAGDKNFPDAYTKKLMDDLNIELTTYNKTPEQLNLDLAGGTLTDIVLTRKPVADQVITGNLAVDLDQYLDTIGKNIASYEQRNAVMRKFKGGPDGKLYFLCPQVGAEVPIDQIAEPWNGYFLNWKYYKEAGAPEINNDDDYLAAMEKMLAIYPENKDGKKTYAMGLNGVEGGMFHWYIRSASIRGFRWVGSYVQDIKTNDLSSIFLNEESPFWSDLEFYNKLNQKGMLDPDSFTMNGDQVKEKFLDGRYVGTYLNWEYPAYNNMKVEEDPNTDDGFVILPANFSWSDFNHFAGWTDVITFVSANSPNVETAVKFLDYMNDPNTSRDFYSGIKGTYWDYDSNNVPVLKEETYSLKANDPTGYKASGISNSYFQDFIASSPASINGDGNPNSLWYTRENNIKALTNLQKDYCDFYKVDLPGDRLKAKLDSGEAFDSSAEIMPLDMSIATIPTNIQRIDTAVDELALSQIAAIIQSPSDEEFAANKQALIAKCKEAGAEEALNWRLERWNEAKTFFEDLLK